MRRRFGFWLIFFLGSGCSTTTTAPTEWSACLFPPYAGITETDGSGSTVGVVDPKDWDCTPESCLPPAYPNPATSGTRLSVLIREDMRVSADIYRSSGGLHPRPVRVRRLVDRTFPAGEHAFLWDLRDDRDERVSPGIYRVVFIAGSEIHCGDIAVR